MSPVVRQVTLAILAALTLTAGIVLAGEVAAHADVVHLPADGGVVVQANPSPTCEEDMPCWSWPTMGDGMRGVVTMHGTPKVVSCAGMRSLIRHRNLDPHSPRLKGDAQCGRTRAYDRRMLASMRGA